MTEPRKYRKKPVEIEAMQLSRSNVAEVESFINGKAREATLPGPGRGTHEGVVIHTLEGDMTASWGDYIIRGVQGEFYPCKPDIFHATYLEVED